MTKIASKEENLEALRYYRTSFEDLPQLKQQVIRNIIKSKARSRAKPDPEKEMMKSLVG